MLRLVALQPGLTLTRILGNKTVHMVQLTIFWQKRGLEFIQRVWICHWLFKWLLRSIFVPDEQYAKLTCNAIFSFRKGIFESVLWKIKICFVHKFKLLSGKFWEGQKSHVGSLRLEQFPKGKKAVYSWLSFFAFYLLSVVISVESFFFFWLCDPTVFF